MFWGLTEGSLHALNSTFKMADKKVRMPATTAGITQFFDDYKSNLEFQPGHVIVLAVIIMIIVILLQIYGGFLIG